MGPKELRCRRCKAFYYYCDNREHSCRYHRGRYHSIVSGGSGLLNMSQAKKWSCCKDLNPDAPGCRVGYHEEDTEFTDFLSESYASISKHSQTGGPRPQNNLHLAPREPRYSTETGGQEEVVEPEKENTEPEEKRVRERDEEGCPKGYQRHRVEPNDTLTKLELAYGTSAAAIKAANQLVTDRDMHSREYLLIPRFVVVVVVFCFVFFSLFLFFSFSLFLLFSFSPSSSSCSFSLSLFFSFFFHCSLVVPSLPPPQELTQAAKEQRKISLFLSIIKCDSFEAR